MSSRNLLSFELQLFFRLLKVVHINVKTNFKRRWRRNEIILNHVRKTGKNNRSGHIPFQRQKP